MELRVKGLQPGRKSSILAHATIELTDGDGDSITIDDLRLLRNRQGQLWVAMPSYSVQEPSAAGRSFTYIPTVVLSRELQRRIEDSVLEAFEERQP